MDGLWATKSEDVQLIACAISFQDFQLRLCGPDPPTSQTLVDQDNDPKVHRAVKLEKSAAVCCPELAQDILFE